MAQRPWYAASYRRNLVDMHIEDWDERIKTPNKRFGDGCDTVGSRI